MHRLAVSQPRNFLAPVVAAVFLPIGLLKVLPLDGIRLSQLAFPLAILLYIFIRVWVEVVRGRRVAEIDAESGRVLIHSVSLLLRQKTSSFALTEFGSVRSYMTPGEFSKNVLELVTTAGGEALLLAWFNPGADKRKWLIPGEIESSEATKLRASISNEFGLRDDGFLGVRWVGKQIKT